MEGSLFLFGPDELPVVAPRPLLVYHPPDIDPFIRLGFGDIQGITTSAHRREGPRKDVRDLGQVRGLAPGFVHGARFNLPHVQCP